MRTLLTESRERGYAVCGNWVTLGVTAVAMPLCTADGRPLGSLSISAVNHRMRSEEHTSELQSQSNLVCRLLLEKKNKSLSSFLLVLQSYTARRAHGWSQGAES